MDWRETDNGGIGYTLGNGHRPNGDPCDDIAKEPFFLVSYHP